jgi:hypothetical protein
MRPDMDTATHPDIGTGAIGAVGISDGGGRARQLTLVKRCALSNEAAPRQGPLFFISFVRCRRTQPDLSAFHYCPFFFDLAFFFITLFLTFGPLSQLKYWQQVDERGVN